MRSRTRQAEYDRSRRQAAIAAGLCGVCYKRAPAEGVKKCARCLARQRRKQSRPEWRHWYAAWRRRRRAIARKQGECIICFKRPVARGLVSKCRRCVEADLTRTRLANRYAFREVVTRLGGRCAACRSEMLDGLCVIGPALPCRSDGRRYVKRLRQLRRHANLTLICGSCWLRRRRHGVLLLEQEAQRA